MTRQLPWLALVLLASPAVAQDPFARALAANSSVAIRLWIPDGAIEVRGWDRDSIDVQGTVAPGSRLSGGGSRAAAKFTLEPVREGDVTLPSAQIRIFVPRTANVWIKSTSARVTVQGVRGQLDVLQVAGPTLLRDMRGVVTVESIDGIIELSRMNGTTRIRGGATQVDLSDIAGRLDVSTVSGDVSLGGPRQTSGFAPALQAHLATVGGSVTVSGGLPEASMVEIETHDGNVSLALLRPTPPRVEATGGVIRIDPSLRDPAGKRGAIVVRTFKGIINASIIGGIEGGTTVPRP